ncbi:MAG TPA: hypothetical protein VOA78_10065 [Candidatus Dormibacteraeota bacterium]|nr:hypothetical protein [Candidatus Dormibacteraeota bacterium]
MPRLLRIVLIRIGAMLLTPSILLLMLGCSASTADEMTSTIVLGSSRIDVTLDSTDWQLARPQLLAWVQRAAEAVAAYYGRYPRPHVSIRVSSSGGHGVHGGMTFGKDGGFIRIRVGRDTTAAELSDDWMMTHEMVHLAYPSMEDEHHWIEEGLATYVEPIGRIQAGQITPESMWADLVRDMPKGQPAEDDRGMDRTHTWGRTYWGGALFSLIADVEIRKKTGNRKGLQDAMRAILEAGGDITDDWPIEKAFKTGDDAVGVAVLLPMYHEWKDKPVRVDLDSLWQQLGIAPDGKGVRFNDKAPLAAIRKAITAPKSSKAAANGAHTELLSVIAGRRVLPR